MENKILHGDSLDLLKELDDNSVDSIVTDPPYGYSFMGKDWDKALPSIDIWKECVRVLKPGAFAFVMSAPRSDVHSRMCLMLEDAGFRIDFTPIAWTYATGFPKAMNIGKKVDKRLGAERKVVGKKKNKLDFNASESSDKSFYDSVWDGGSNVDLDITEPASDEAKQIMIASDSEWERIFPLTGAGDRTSLIHLRDTYRNGIPLNFGDLEIEETKKAFKILSKFGGRDLTGKSNEISEGTFWRR